MSSRASHPRPVHPRWVWLGLALALTGCGLLGLAATEASPLPTGVLGLAVLVAGATVATRAGGRYDVHSGSPAAEARQVLEGDVHQGVAPGDQVTNSSARRTARELTARTRRLHEERRRTPRPPLAPIGAALVLAVAVFLLVAQWEIYPLGRTSQNNARRALLIAVIATLAALRIILGQPSPHRIACSLLLLCGTALVAQGSLVDHETAATAGVEIVTGLLVLIGSLACALSPTPPLVRSRSRYQRR